MAVRVILPPGPATALRTPLPTRSTPLIPFGCRDSCADCLAGKATFRSLLGVHCPWLSKTGAALWAMGYLTIIGVC